MAREMERIFRLRGEIVQGLKGKGFRVTRDLESFLSGSRDGGP